MISSLWWAWDGGVVVPTGTLIGTWSDIIVASIDAGKFALEIMAASFVAEIPASKSTATIPASKLDAEIKR